MSENNCAECGMWNPPAFHPYAACLMFKGGADSGLIAAVMDQFEAFITAERTAKEAAEAEAVRLRGEIERLRFAGGRMSNVCFNLAQADDMPGRFQQALDSVRRQWDDELRALLDARQSAGGA